MNCTPFYCIYKIFQLFVIQQSLNDFYLVFELLSCYLLTIQTFGFIAETSTSTRVQPRLRDEKKISESGKQNKTSTDTSMDTTKVGNPDDVYEFKSVKETDNSPDAKGGDNLEVDNDGTESGVGINLQPDESNKRNFSEMSEAQGDSVNDEESRRKKRKEEGNKETKGTATQRTSGQTKNQGGKQGTGTQGKSGLSCSKSSKLFLENLQQI